MDEMKKQGSGPFDTSLLKQRRAAGCCGPDYLLRPAGEELLARLDEAWRDLVMRDDGGVGSGDDPKPAVKAPGAAGCGSESEAVRLLACGPGWLAAEVQAWAARNVPGAQVLWGQWLAAGEEAPPGTRLPALVLDHERLPLAQGSIDVALVLFDLALVNDLPEALREWRRVLRPGGLLLAVLPGGETLRELRAAWVAAERLLAQERGLPVEDLPPGWRVAPFLEMRQLAGLAGMAGFSGVVSDVERLTVRYPDALALMRELKEAGWSNPLRQRPRTPVCRRLLGLAAAEYELSHAAMDGRVPATFELLYLTAMRPASAS